MPDAANRHEYVAHVGTYRNDTLGKPMLYVNVATVREFSALTYALELALLPAAAGKGIIVEIGGLQVATTVAGASGPAHGRVAVDVPADGTYGIQFRRKHDTVDTSVIILNGTVTDATVVSGVLPLTIEVARA